METAGRGGREAKRRKVKKEKESSTGHSPEECPVCWTVFDETGRRPRTLPCGHTLCTLCVNELKEKSPLHIVCPKCRGKHKVPKKGQFPINYALEAFIETEDDEAAAADSPPPSDGPSRNTGMLSLLQAKEASVVADITACQEFQAQLDQYQTALSGWGEQQQHLENRLHDLLNQSKSAREQVLQEQLRAWAKKEEAREGERHLHVALEALSTPASYDEGGLAVGEMFRCTDMAEQMLEECRGSFSDTNTATTISKVTKAFNAALESYHAVQSAIKTFQSVQATLKTHPSASGEDLRFQRCPTCTIVTPGLRVEDLRSPTQPVRRMLEDGRVFGVHQVLGQRRQGRISFEASRLYLHTLREEPLPPGALQVNHAVMTSPPCTVFLDLTWPGSPPRRVHILLSPDTPRGRQAVQLCTGQCGPSYAGTHFFEVANKGRSGECVWGGDYESNDGRGGAALLPGLDNGEYWMSEKAGAVWGWYSKPGSGAVFAIRTRDWQLGGGYGGVFGEVVQGLDAVVAAAQHTPITEVTIEDCGVVL